MFVCPKPEFIQEALDMHKYPKYVEGCPYCEGFLAPNAQEKDKIWNTILFESEHFVVVPTLGMILPGWLLIVAKQHLPNFAVLPEEWYSELKDIKARVHSKESELFHEPIVFEHGPKPGDATVGSCIDHAHLHMIPIDRDILSELNTHYTFNRISNLHELRTHYREKGAYLYYENQRHEKYVCTAKQVPSQFIRQLIAHKCGKENRWDWAVFPETENIQKTVKHFEVKGNGRVK
ncbi:hypothetical protein HYR99_16420 [Candidatus Poribacteria bacterium]|nr:hypothetical protein [Candidatus Poribacteria bacterium]